MAIIPLKIKQLPPLPGVYFFINTQKKILYIGKAKNLRKRVASYWQQTRRLPQDKQILIGQVAKIDFIITKTEIDALVLEHTLIKKHQPRFNILAKDDKDYLYMEITQEKFPRILLSRHPDLRHESVYYGPYPAAKSLQIVFKLLHRAFPFRTCKRIPNQACLEYYLHRCPGPCLGKIKFQDYFKIIQSVLSFFENKEDIFTQKITKKMQQAAHCQKYELAAQYRDQLNALRKLQTIKKTPERYLQDFYANKNIDPKKGLEQLQKALRIKKLQRIEIYDISNIQGQFAVGSQAVFINGLPAKEYYRRYKIKTIHKNNDQAMLHEVVQRRLQHSDWPKPDLVIVDGGLPQLSAVEEMLQSKKIPVIALAKRNEDIYSRSQKKAWRLPAGSQGYFFLERMRDEAHRFAIAYYRFRHKHSLRQAD